MLEQIKSYYQNYDEDGRLFRDKSRLTEYLVTVRYFDRLFNKECKILDACAGTGRYSFYLADKGHIVTSCDLVGHNTDIIRANPNSNKLSNIRTCNVLDLSCFSTNSFDVVLCMGAMYHLASEDEKQRAVSECVRVCKPDGIVAFSYISKIGAIFLRLQNGLHNIRKVLDILKDEEEGIFRCMFPKQIEEIARDNGIDMLYNIGTDGTSQLFQEKINTASEDEFDMYMDYMHKTCEDKNILGTSLHCLYFGKVKKENEISSII